MAIDAQIYSRLPVGWLLITNLGAQMEAFRPRGTAVPHGERGAEKIFFFRGRAEKIFGGERGPRANGERVTVSVRELEPWNPERTDRSTVQIDMHGSKWEGVHLVLLVPFFFLNRRQKICLVL